MIKKLRALIEFDIVGDGAPSHHSLTMEAGRECSIQDLAMKVAEMLEARVQLLGREFVAPLAAALEQEKASHAKLAAHVAEMEAAKKPAAQQADEQQAQPRQQRRKI